MPARRPCPTVGCPTLITRSQRACPTCERTRDQARGTRQARGYDATYDRTRKAWAPKVKAGLVTCWRCRQPIQPDDEWHLGHDDDRHVVGPEHQQCNLRAAGQASHRE